MNVGPSKAREAACPACPMTNLFDDIFEALAAAARDEPQQGPSSQLQRRSDRAQGRVLLRNPVKGIEGNDEVELFPVGQTAGGGHLETEVRVSLGTHMAPCADHPIPRPT